MSGPRIPSDAPALDTFGGRLRAERLRCGLTLQALADDVGCTRAYLSLIEHRADGGNVGAYVLAAIARRLGTTFEYLLCGVDAPPPSPPPPLPPQRASIRVLYRAEVAIPEHIAEREQFTTAYGRFRDSFATLDGNAFTHDTPCGLIEGFEANSLQDAQRFVDRWLARLAEWEGEGAVPR